MSIRSFLLTRTNLRAASSHRRLPIYASVCALGAVLVGALLVVDAYGGEAFWSELTAGFGASLAAFVLALQWDRHRERSRDTRALADIRSARATESSRRLESVAEELRGNLISLRDLDSWFGQEQLMIMHPQLLDAAWHANGTRLSELLTDYELTSRLATTYGRIEELRWRLRARTSQIGIPETGAKVAASLDTMTRPLVAELVVEVASLVERVDTVRQAPASGTDGRLLVDAATVVGRASPRSE